MDHPALRALALALLTNSEHISRKGGSFLGQIVVDDTPLTPKQFDWLRSLAERANLTHMMEADNG